jgi:hypothetical protein
LLVSAEREELKGFPVKVAPGPESRVTCQEKYFFSPRVDRRENSLFGVERL